MEKIITIHIKRNIRIRNDIDIQYSLKYQISCFVHRVELAAAEDQLVRWGFVTGTAEVIPCWKRNTKSSRASSISTAASDNRWNLHEIWYFQWIFQDQARRALIFRLICILMTPSMPGFTWNDMCSEEIYLKQNFINTFRRCLKCSQKTYWSLQVHYQGFIRYFGAKEWHRKPLLYEFSSREPGWRFTGCLSYGVEWSQISILHWKGRK